MSKNPNSRHLVRETADGWRCITLFDIDNVLGNDPQRKLPLTLTGKVRMFLELMEIGRINVIWSRYFDTVDYEDEQRKEDPTYIRSHTGSCV